MVRKKEPKKNVQNCSWYLFTRFALTRQRQCFTKARCKQAHTLYMYICLLVRPSLRRSVSQSVSQSVKQPIRHIYLFIHMCIHISMQAYKHTFVDICMHKSMHTTYTYNIFYIYRINIYTNMYIFTKPHPIMYHNFALARNGKPPRISMNKWWRRARQENKNEPKPATINPMALVCPVSWCNKI